jgi:class 3 adenylate cyclase/tetratricopeptide (TPR) repeat protein
MDERTHLEQTIAALEGQRTVLGDAIVDTALAPLREKLSALQPAPTARRLQATILFADLSGFTALSDARDAEDIADLMNAVWQRLDAVITHHGGIIDKHIGDAVMALWGVIQPQEDDPARAVRAALDLHAILAAIQAERALMLQVRIGLNTGTILYGAVGSTQEWTAMGDAVNLASRLEHAAPRGGTLIAHTTYQHVRGLFNITVLPPIQVKGKPQPIPIYQVNYANPHTLAIPWRGVEGVETRMIGRDAELQQLQTAMEQSRAGQPLRAFMIIGEAGIGKSRLLHAYRAWIEETPYLVRLFCGRATPDLQLVPYALLRDVLAFRFQIHDSDPRAVAYTKLVAGVQSFLAASLDAAMVSQHVTALAQVVGLTDSPESSTSSDPTHLHTQALAALTALMTAIHADAPTLISLEDIHWADAESLDLFRSLEERCAGLRIVLVYLARPVFLEHESAWSSPNASHQHLTLTALPPTATAALITEILRHVVAIPPALQTFLVARTEGNPFYVEEVIKMLIEQQVIIPGEPWTIDEAKLQAAEIPSTLQGVLQARVARLPAEDQAVLHRAAVIGRQFWDTALVALGADPLRVEHQLARLVQREVIFAVEGSLFTPAREYAFKHALLRDVAYAGILRRERRLYHQHVAEWLETVSGDRVAAYAGSIAQHYLDADVPQAAGRWYIQAGQQAQQSFALEAAYDAYQRGLRLLAPIEHPPVQLELAQICNTLGRWEEALAIGQQVLADPLTTPNTAAHMHEVCGIIWTNRGQYALAQDALTAAAATFQRLGQLREYAVILGHMGMLYVRQRRYQEAEVVLREGLVIAEAEGDPTAQFLALNGLGRNLYMQGEYRRARSSCEQAVLVARAAKDRYRLALGLNMLGTVETEEGAHDKAWMYLDEALPLAELLGDRNTQALCLGNLGYLAKGQGQWSRAEQIFRQVLLLFDALGNDAQATICLAHLSELAYIQNDYMQAKVLVRDYLQRSSVQADWTAQLWAESFLGFVALAEQKWTTAYHLFSTTLTEEVVEYHHRQFVSGRLFGIAALGCLAPWADHPSCQTSIQILAGAVTLNADISTNSIDHSLYEITRRTCAAHLGSEYMAEAWVMGEQMSVDALIATAQALLASMPVEDP